MKFTSSIVALCLASASLAKPTYECSRQELMTFEEEQCPAVGILDHMTRLTERTQQDLRKLGGSGRYEMESNKQDTLLDIVIDLTLIQHSAYIGTKVLQNNKEKYDQNEQKQVVQKLERFTQVQQKMFEEVINKRHELMNTEFHYKIREQFQYSARNCRTFFQELEKVCPNERQQIERQQEKWVKEVQRVMQEFGRGGQGGGRGDREW